KDGRSRTDGNTLLALLQGAPGLITFPVAQPAVQHGNIITKNHIKTLDDLWSKPDFGDQHQPALPLLQCYPEGVNIDLRLAAAGNTMQQEGVELVFIQRLTNLLKSLLLLFIQSIQPGRVIFVAQAQI